MQINEPCQNERQHKDSEQSEPQKSDNMMPTDISGVASVVQHLILRGEVQGIGLRPRVKRWADELGLRGWICNQGDQVALQVAGPAPAVQQLQDRLRALACAVDIIELDHDLAPGALSAQSGFAILPGEPLHVDRLYQVPADRGICETCLLEFHDPADRRYHYPFISCNDCGPRFSILTALPFARANTAYARLPPCRKCQEDFADPANRRFHSELISCEVCGPRLFGVGLADIGVSAQATPDDLIRRALACLNGGGIVGLKSLSGMQLLARADNESAVRRLRERKQRPLKPLALLVPSLAWAQRLAQVSEAAAQWLTSPQRPIVLLPKTKAADTQLAPSVAPDVPDLGLMLPVTALQSWLVESVDAPLVCTSANVSDEPILFANADLETAVGTLCDFALLHDLEIEFPQDDSVLMENQGRTTLLRRARGFCHTAFPVPPGETTLAVGGDLKNTFALARGGVAVLGPHLGDLESVKTLQRRDWLLDQFSALQDFTPRRICVDAHPGYISRQQAQRLSQQTEPLGLQMVQHHRAHLLANQITCPLPARYLALMWDGNGYGDDGTLWGSEAFLVDAGKITRVAALAPFPLPGGVQALLQPWRLALSLSFAAGISRADVLQRLVSNTVPESQLAAVWQLLEKNLNCPVSCAMGRLFDAMSYLLLGTERNEYEGYAPVQLQYCAQRGLDDSTALQRDGQGGHAPPFAIQLRTEGDLLVGDWQPAWRDFFYRTSFSVSAQNAPASVQQQALAFHRGVADWALALAHRFNVDHLSLSGGCFQNRLLQSLLLERAEPMAVHLMWPATVPLNDGGLALGQVAFPYPDKTDITT